MSRPLVITDCDEVLLHMVVPFRDWLADVHAIDFTMNGNDFAKSMRRADGSLIEQAEMWDLLGRFFDTEMPRQTPIAGAFAALEAVQAVADVVVLTNLEHHRQEARTQQLADLGMPLRVFTNQGPKGPAIQAILREYNPSRAVFIDDIAVHHGSAADITPHVTRLHLCGEPLLAPHIPCAHQAGHAHARIDDWHGALPWLMAQLHGDD
ncbi:HAD family hydrolase [Novosphingobium sp. FSY-8]|uniref:HAD family hydrolase n=1 Tax=Novosphingobium ovatum TaxID=1908523 RepID=A0ABW9XGS0_9SPHN|nr:HAD family hydrolase [Novosphingobium ovatum]NBC37673.1 HAD family hydrolase [Novosphingobium ovatum]